MSRRPTVVVNTAIYLHGTSGSATATRELVGALRTLPDVDVHEVAPKSRGGRSSVLNALADARWDLWQAARALPQVDLLVSPVNIGLRGRARRHLLVLHDVMAIERPELFDRKFALYFRLLVPASVRSADRVLTLSERVAAAVRRLDDGADVRVISWSHAGGTAVRARFPVEQPTVLMVGATDPVKNQVAGISAVAEVRRRSGRDIRLRLLGPVGRAEGDVRAALALEDPRGVWSSREVDVPVEQLRAAYASAWCLLQPSHDEGFGLPLVEAARHSLPVVHSGRGAMPHVLPEVDAGGVDASRLGAAMMPMLDPGCWAEVADRTYARAADFAPEAFHAQIRDAVADLLAPS